MLRRKIDKLLALSASPNEAEAAAALAKARHLLGRYGEAPDGSLSDERIVERDVTAALGQEPWRERLLAAVERATRTRSVRLTDGNVVRLLLVGRESRMISAERLFGYLADAVERHGEGFAPVVRDKASFRLGMVDRLRARLEEDIALDGAAMVDELERSRRAREDILAHIRDTWGEVSYTEETISYDEGSYSLGRAIGNKIPLNRQLDRSEEDPCP